MKHPTFTRILAGAAFALALTGAAWAKVDINHATEAQLQALHGVGPAKAHSIVVERQAHGRFNSLDDISKRVPGIGAATVTGFASDVSFAPASVTSTVAARTPAPAAAMTPAAPKATVHAAATASTPAVVHPGTPAAVTKTGAATTHTTVGATAVTTHAATTGAVTPPTSAVKKKT